MLNNKKQPVFKFFAYFISLLLFFNLGLIADAQSENPYTKNFNSAKEKFFSGDFESARGVLENLVAQLSQVEGNDTLKGYSYLLLGAVYEKQANKNLSIKYFCKAKETLDKDKTIGGLELSNYKNYSEDCTGVLALIQAYDEAYDAYFADDYKTSKKILEKQVAQLEGLSGIDTLKGESYLLMGATYEKLDYKQPAIKYYCKAKAILGKGKTIEGLELKKLKWYKKGCESGVVSRVGKKRKGGFLGLVLGLAILGGIIWYLFINENSPLKKDQTWTELVNTYKFETEWLVTINATWSGPAGTISYSPDPDYAPTPNEGNSWDDTQTMTFSKSGGGILVSKQIIVEVWLKGCNYGVRKDKIYINDIAKMERTTTFSNDCSAAAIDAEKIHKTLHTQASLAEIKIRHVLDLSGNTKAGNITVIVNSKTVNN